MVNGTLYIVATPIGNLNDITPRAITVLKQVDFIAAEDTRHSKKLMVSFGINTPLMAYHDHNEGHQSNYLLQQLATGHDIALISDSGTPLISDPGYQVVHKARENGYKVVPVVGACALIAALSVSGLPTDRFFFAGFLSAKAASRRKQLTTLANVDATLVLYESTHRILDCLLDLKNIFDEHRTMVIAREMTKKFETILYGSIQSIEEQLLTDANQCKGEFVLVIEGKKFIEYSDIDEITKKILSRLLQEMPVKKATSILAETTEYTKNQLYQCALTLKSL